MGKTISIFNQKGGVGKTTTCVNLAAALGDKGKKTLLVDIDPQGNSTSGVGIDKAVIANSTYDILINKVPAGDIVTATEFKNLYLLPATMNLAGAELELAEMEDRYTSLKKALAPIVADFDYIIIDCPPSADFLIEVVMDAVDNVVIPIKPERFSADGLATVQEVIRDFGHGQVKAGCLFTQFYRNKDILKVVRRVLDTENVMAYENVIRRCAAVDHSVLVRRPLLKCASRSSAALDYIDFTREYLKKEEGEDGIA